MTGGNDRAELGEFLASRRARITPDQVGLPVYDAGKRRVPGLRRGEVATLAGLSVDYYTQLERGKAAGVSESVLDAIARALQLDEAERSHLADLHRSVTTSPQRRARPKRATAVRPMLRRLLDGLTLPAMIGNARQDLVAANPLGYAFYAPLYPDPQHPDPAVPVNFARFCFLDTAASEFYPDWDFMADVAVNNLRTEAGRDPYDRDLSDLVGELSTRSEEFRVRWAKHNVRLHRTGTKRFHHPVVGEMEVGYETIPLPADPGLRLTVYSPEPASPSADALTLLATWAATTAQSTSTVSPTPPTNTRTTP
ncbi:transcriptional regulator with XRE-family HTH domain [Actinomycetospora succinea]|uniref:Transcriptional regulator with XRE-family HTH domain n=1 Tax=Actinomycetospora succinea TaxID=663603 RepID=A0A4R6VDQ7_9PSEU|nr:helix-turn-helix transcriptional regulator [Actinomycetospora succinea]TDQ58874.1 transcriptional regulator with XRE-family HTH domain [Actinomycetospora succinea]